MTSRRWVREKDDSGYIYKLERTSGEVWGSCGGPQWFWKAHAGWAYVDGREDTRERAQQECERWIDAHEVTT